MREQKRGVGSTRREEDDEVRGGSWNTKDRNEERERGDDEVRG